MKWSRWSWLLLLAFAPSLLYVGHLSFQLPVPGTSLSLGIAAVHSHGTAGEEANHRDHCHADVSDCSGTPPTTAVPIATLREDVEASARFGGLPLAGVVPPVLFDQRSVMPEGPPPRATPLPEPA